MSRLPLRGIDPTGADATNDTPRFDPATGHLKYQPGGGAGAKVAALKYGGTLTVGVGATRLYNDTGKPWTITSVRASVESAPSGGSVVIDVNVNDTTIFTTQANRPTIPANATTSGKVTTMDVTAVPDGDYLTVDVDITTAPAANLTVLIGLL